jgi:hypothetical protein
MRFNKAASAVARADGGRCSQAAKIGANRHLISVESGR